MEIHTQVTTAVPRQKHHGGFVLTRTSQYVVQNLVLVNTQSKLAFSKSEVEIVEDHLASSGYYPGRGPIFRWGRVIRMS
jgi:hypothetical protein